MNDPRRLYSLRSLPACIACPWLEQSLYNNFTVRKTPSLNRLHLKRVLFVTVYMPLLMGKCGTLVVDISLCASSLVETSDIRDEGTYYFRRI